jgi:succinate dehydrogenase / fumarate reductase cytochrome b subunit
VLAFIVFHLMHFTIKNVHPEYKELYTQLEGVGTMHGVYDKLSAVGKETVHDVYSMVAIGFGAQYWYISLGYVVAMALLCMHLMHGISSMFQSLGLRNAGWRKRLDKAAVAIALIVFVGFVSIPVAVLAGLIQPITTL